MTTKLQIYNGALSLIGERLLANIAPGNDASLMLFRGLGFGGPIQVTLERPA